MHHEIKIKYLIFLLLCCWASVCHAANDKMPIIAYWGVPQHKTNEEAFRTFAECGFNVSLYPYNSLDNLVSACRTAQRYGIKIIGSCPEMVHNPEKAASVLKSVDGFWGYLLQDEPSFPEIKQQQLLINKIQDVDNSHLFYINILPYYGLLDIKADSYPDYIKALTSTSCQQISFDFYPITTEEIRPEWYMNLEMIREESLRSGKPFWGFVLSVPHIFYPQPTLASLRLQAYSNLAYGAQAIQYFTYWTPPPTEEYDFHDAPMSEEGKKTKTYDTVQLMNKELKIISKLFYNAKVISVQHMGNTIPVGTTRLTTLPDNIKHLRVRGRQGAIVSQFQKDGHLYMAIVNKSHEGPLNVNIQKQNSIPKYITKNLTEEELKASYTVSAGDILLVKIE